MQLYATIVLVSFLIAFSLKAFSDTVRVVADPTLSFYNIVSFFTWTSDKIKSLAILHLIFIVYEVHSKMAATSAQDARQRNEKLSRVKIVTYTIYGLMTAIESVVRALHLFRFRKDA